jgi:hypothetical protein
MPVAARSSALRWGIRCAGIVAVVWLAPTSKVRAQMTFVSGPNAGERRVQWELLANGVGGDSGFPSDVSSSPSLPFHGVAEGTVFTSWINNLDESASSGAFGRLTQDSVLASFSIVSSSDASFSAQLSNADSYSGGGANARGWSTGDVFFRLDQYCRFTLSGNVSANVSCVAEPDFNVGSNAGVEASLSVALGDTFTYEQFGAAYGTASAGYGHLADSLSADVSTTGFLQASGSSYVLASQSHVDVGVGPHGTGSGEGSASTSVSLTLEPMGTRLVGLEVIQTIQDWNNSVPLVAGKPTYVRAHVEPISATSVPIMNPRLRGYDSFGQELPDSPRTPTRDSASTAWPGAADPDRRTNWNYGTVNFELPPTWTSNFVRLRVEMDGLVGGNASLEHYAWFFPSPQLDLRIVNVISTDGAGGFDAPPEWLVEQELYSLASIYPIVPGAIHSIQGGLTVEQQTVPTVIELLEHVSELRYTSRGVPESTIYVALSTTHLVGDDFGRAQSIPGSVVALTAGSGLPFVLAHELGHALGEFHVVNESIFGTRTFSLAQAPVEYLPELTWVRGPCGALVPKNRATDFTFIDVNGDPRIGPLGDGANALVFGLEVPVRLDGSFYPDVHSPYDEIELMAPGACSADHRWISSFTYSRLWNAMNERFGTFSGSSPARSDLAAGGDVPQSYLIIRGLVDLSSNIVTLLPFIPVALDAPPISPEGSSHLLNVYCKVGGVTTLSDSIPFTPIIPSGEAGDGDETKGFFSIPVACAAADLVRVEILRDDAMLASLDRSAVAPVIQLVSPNGGEVLGSTPFVATWDASDADGDPLTYQVQFSPDAGQNWQTLAFDWSTDEFPLSGDSLPATTSGLLRVVASDGVNASASQSAAPFTIPNHAPKVLIISPSPGGWFGADDPIVFEVLLKDLEDGALPTDSVTWTSSLDGLLGNGSRVETDALALSEGSHLITVTVVDSAEASDSASVQITVSRLPADRDGDGVPDHTDGCPDDVAKSAPGPCGCGVIDDLTDGDGDGVIGCEDDCVSAANADQQDSDGDGAGDACDACIAFWTVPGSTAFACTGRWADLAPRGALDDRVSVADLVQLARFLSGRDLASATEVSHGDVAPHSTEEGTPPMARPSLALPRTLTAADLDLVREVVLGRLGFVPPI